LYLKDPRAALRDHASTMDPLSPESSITTASSADEANAGEQPPADPLGAIGLGALDGLLPFLPLLPTPSSVGLTAEHSGEISFEWRLRAMVQAERSTWMVRGVDPVDYWCNIPGVNFASDLFDRQGDSEGTRSVLAYLRTRHLQSIGIKPEAWMIPKVMCKRGDGSWGLIP
jgi:hypothetical protein